MRCAVCDANLEGQDTKGCFGCGISWCYTNCPDRDVFEFNKKDFCSTCWEQGDNTYYCTICPPEMCASSKCEIINNGDERGICCFAAYEPESFCSACVKWKRDRNILLLGIRKFRPKTLLAKLPRDLLRYIIEKEGRK